MAQHPGAAGRAPQKAFAGERLQRQRHRRALGADELADELIGDRELDDDAVGSNRSPALGGRR
jgi:hypothetical protein